MTLCRDKRNTAYRKTCLGLLKYKKIRIYRMGSCGKKCTAPKNKLTRI